jgi:hypothetical protein
MNVATSTMCGMVKHLGRHWYVIVRLSEELWVLDSAKSRPIRLVDDAAMHTHVADALEKRAGQVLVVSRTTASP